MGKRGRAELEKHSGGEDNIADNKCSGRGNYGDLSVFEFDHDDRLVEKESRITLAKFGTKSPNKRTLRHRPPIDKYDFLEHVALGNTAQQNDAGRDVINVDVTDDHPQSFLKDRGFECSSRGEKSCTPRIQKPVGHTIGKKHVLYVDSDDEKQIEVESSSSSLDLCLAENEGSPVEQSSEHGASNNECEAVVVVAPHYVKYENKHCTTCRLIFSQKRIRLEGSTPSQNLEWSTLDILKIEYQHCESVKADFVKLHLRSKDIDVLDTGNWKSGNEELEFVVIDKPQWSEKLEDIKSLDLKYKDSWETIISECYFDESFEDIIYPDGDSDAVFISRRDIELLRPRTFINDTIIDFYIKYLVNKTNREKQHRFHFFNSFFFQKLWDAGRDMSRTCEGSDTFQHVRKWTRNVNIFEKDYIFIPVNLSLHWSLIVICHPGEVANLRDMDSSSKLPCILHMDSIRGSHGGLKNLIRSYLGEEWKARGNKQSDDISIKFSHLEFIELQVPQQENLFDCGLFLLHYAELFLRQVLNSSEIKYGEFFNEDWFLSAEVSLKKRDHIKKLIHGIVKDNALKKPPAAPSNQHTQSGTNSVQQNSSEIDENSPPCKLLLSTQLPCNQFNSMTLPIEDTTHGKQATLPQGADTSSPYESEGDNNFQMKKLEVSQENILGESPILVDSENEDDDCVFDVASSIGLQKGFSISSMSSEDLNACIVEDSEEEG